MNDRLAFQQAINANPRDRELQLIYADWLADRSEPQEAFWRGSGSDSFLGRVGRGGLGGLVGRVGSVGEILNPENPIVLIPGENAVVFISDGYYVSVIIGHVAQELAHGWIVDPCWELLSIGESDTLIQLAAGTKAGVRELRPLFPKGGWQDPAAN